VQITTSLEIRYEKSIAPLRIRILSKAFGGAISVGKNVRIGTGCKFQFGEGSIFTIEDNATIRNNCMIIVHANSELVLKASSYIGSWSEIHARKKIRIGANSLVAQRCVLIDHNHKWNEESGVQRKEFLAKEIEIGDNVWICAGVIVVAGAQIEDKAVVPAGSVARGHVGKYKNS